MSVGVMEDYKLRDLRASQVLHLLKKKGEKKEKLAPANKSSGH
jgi:hypothetical protein